MGLERREEKYTQVQNWICIICKDEFSEKDIMGLIGHSKAEFSRATQEHKHLHWDGSLSFDAISHKCSCTYIQVEGVRGRNKAIRHNDCLHLVSSSCLSIHQTHQRQTMDPFKALAFLSAQSDDQSLHWCLQPTCTISACPRFFFLSHLGIWCHQWVFFFKKATWEKGGKTNKTEVQLELAKEVVQYCALENFSLPHSYVPREFQEANSWCQGRCYSRSLFVESLFFPKLNCLPASLSSQWLCSQCVCTRCWSAFSTSQSNTYLKSWLWGYKQYHTT